MAKLFPVVARDPKIVCSVLMKLSGGSSKLSEHLNVDAFIEQARAYDKEKNVFVDALSSSLDADARALRNDDDSPRRAGARRA